MSLPSASMMPGQTALASDASGPVRFMNPTARYVAVPRLPSAGGRTAAGETTARGKDADSSSSSSSKVRHHVYHIWRSRDNRKGRHAVVVSRAFYLHSLQHHHLREHEEKVAARRAAALRATNSLRETLRGVGKMATCWPVWDISFDVAVLFTLGSAIWVINSFFVWLPLQVPSATFTNESGTGGSVTALVGATVFEVGALLGLLEAVNENRSDCFGWALEEIVASGTISTASTASTPSSGLLLRPSPDSCRHHQAQRRQLLGGRGSSPSSDDSAGSADTITTALPDSEAADGPNHSDSDVSEENDADDADGTTGTVREQPSPGTSPLRHHRHQRQWSWCPSRHELRTHYLHEIGFWACASQVVAATIFWISGFTGLPPVLDCLPLAAQNGIFWLPQVVGGVGFVISSLLFMLETQPRWYMPAPGLLGWHIGLWNLVGSIGFTLCGAFGFAATQSHNMEYASSLSTFIGSWAFLIGSIIQWYESLDKYPVAIKSSLRGEDLK